MILLCKDKKKKYFTVPFTIFRILPKHCHRVAYKNSGGTELFFLCRFCLCSLEILQPLMGFTKYIKGIHNPALQCYIFQLLII